MPWVTAAIILIASVACFVTTRDANATTRTSTRIPLTEQARTALSNRPFLLLLGIKYLGLYALSATVMTNIFSLLPDVMEHDFQRTGLRREGLYAGLYSFIEKFAFATAPLTLGVLLSTMGFEPGLPRGASQPESALLAITLSMAVIPAIANALKVPLALTLRTMPASAQAR
mgnify:CR=1 FL=1